MSDSTSLTHCANCGQRLNPWDKFCSQCGQDTLDHPPSFWEFVHEWSLHYVAVEGKLWKSLWALLARPGFLTMEYLAGRKQRYVLPLRLLLTFGLLFFFSLKFVPSAVDEALQAGGPPSAAAEPAEEAEAAAPGASVASPAPSASTTAQALEEAGLPPAAASALAGVAKPPGVKAPPVKAPVIMDAEDRDKLPVWLRKPLERAEKRFSANREAAWVHFKGTLLSLAPYAVLVSLPLFAVLLKLLYPRTVYGAHFLFALHLHAAWYLLLLLGVMLQGFGWAGFLLWIWGNLYPLLALRRVYGASWPLTLLRAVPLALMHWVLIGVMFMGLAVIGLVSA